MTTNCVGGIREKRAGFCSAGGCRPSINNPPTALVGFERSERGFSIARGCRPSINNPPTALVGFGMRAGSALL